jgi:zinc protease
MRAAEIYALDNQNRRARQIGAALASGLTLEDVADWPDLLQQVTAEDVADAARAVFRPEASVTAWMLAPEPDRDPEPAEAVGQ